LALLRILDPRGTLIVYLAKPKSLRALPRERVAEVSGVDNHGLSWAHQTRKTLRKAVFYTLGVHSKAVSERVSKPQKNGSGLPSAMKRSTKIFGELSVRSGTFG
jgi:hypothetical protein